MESPPHIVQLSPLSPELDAALLDTYKIHPLWEEQDRAAFLTRHGRRFQGVVTSATVGASEDLLAALPSLKVIASRGVGVDKIDLKIARSRGVQVSITPDALTDCVADHAFGLLINVAREISSADRFVRAGQWLHGQYRLTTRVSGKRLGIVGLGNIGQAIAKRAGGFKMEVRYTTRKRVDNTPYEYEPSILDLAYWADFLMLTVSGGAGSHLLISSSVLEKLGPQGFLINISRGTVVDQNALVSALTNRIIAGAGLDVYQDEPNVPEEFNHLNNVVLTPHMASGTIETRKAMDDLVLANLEAFFRTGNVRTPAC